MNIFGLQHENSQHHYNEAVTFIVNITSFRYEHSLIISHKKARICLCQTIIAGVKSIRNKLQLLLHCCLTRTFKPNKETKKIYIFPEIVIISSKIQ